jgi:hypothetical protein
MKRGPCADGAAASCDRASAVASTLMRSELARQLMPELRHAATLRPAALLGRQCNLWRLNATKEPMVFWEMHHNSSRALQPHANVYGLRLAGPSITRPRLRTGCHDLELGAVTQTLGPDSFYQTLMSEHAGIIALGPLLERRRLRTLPGWIGSASWKHAIKGRPLPCDFLRRFNWSGLDADALVYWGPKAGPVQAGKADLDSRPIRTGKRRATHAANVSAVAAARGRSARRPTRRLIFQLASHHWHLTCPPLPTSCHLRLAAHSPLHSLLPLPVSSRRRILTNSRRRRRGSSRGGGI